MPLVDYEQIEEYVRRLDDLVPSNGATVHKADLTEGCQHPQSSTAYFRGLTIQANRLGYLRLGIEFLKAAFAEASDAARPYGIEHNVRAIKGMQNIHFDFERSEVRHEEDNDDGSSLWIDVYALVFSLAFVVFLLASVVVGAFTIFGWVTGRLLA